jgi:hypothetical protein
MSWNYRVLKTEDQHGTHFGIHEVYYDESGRPRMYSESPMSPYGETLEELADDLKRFSSAFTRPVLCDEDFNKEKKV